MNTSRIIGVVVAFVSLVFVGCGSGKKGGGGGGSGSGDVPVPAALVAGDVISVTLNDITDDYFGGILAMTVGAGDTIAMDTALPAPFNNTTATYTYTPNGASWDLVIVWTETVAANRELATLTITGGRFGESGIAWVLRRWWMTDPEEQESAPDNKITRQGTGAEVTRITP